MKREEREWNRLMKNTMMKFVLLNTPMVKYADRIANLRFSVMNAIEHESEECIRKAKMYIKEMNYFNESVIRENVDIEYTVPKLMIKQSEEIISQYKEKYLN